MLIKIFVVCRVSVESGCCRMEEMSAGREGSSTYIGEDKRRRNQLGAGLGDKKRTEEVGGAKEFRRRALQRKYTKKSVPFPTFFSTVILYGGFGHEMAGLR